MPVSAASGTWYVSVASPGPGSVHTGQLVTLATLHSPDTLTAPPTIKHLAIIRICTSVQFLQQIICNAAAAVLQIKIFAAQLRYAGVGQLAFCWAKHNTDNTGHSCENDFVTASRLLSITSSLPNKNGKFAEKSLFSHQN